MAHYGVEPLNPGLKFCEAPKQVTHAGHDVFLPGAVLSGLISRGRLFIVVTSGTCLCDGAPAFSTSNSRAPSNQSTD
jgi:hypothetical protein